MLDRLNVKTPACGFDIELGWFPIVERAIKKMIGVGWDRQLSQVKQKFCQLRIYLVGEVPDEVAKVIADAATEADGTCELCGKEREGRGSAMGMALCALCKLGFPSP